MARRKKQQTTSRSTSRSGDRRLRSRLRRSCAVVQLTANQIVAYNLAQARMWKNWTQEEAAAELEPFLGARWSKASSRLPSGRSMVDACDSSAPMRSWRSRVASVCRRVLLHASSHRASPTARSVWHRRRIRRYGRPASELIDVMLRCSR